MHIGIDVLEVTVSDDKATFAVCGRRCFIFTSLTAISIIPFLAYLNVILKYYLCICIFVFSK